MVDTSKYKRQRTGKNCLSKYSFIYCACQPWPRTAYSSTSNNTCHNTTSLEDDNADFEVDTKCSSKDPHFPNQNELDDLTRDLGLTKVKAEILSSRQRNGICLLLRARFRSQENDM